MALVKSAPDLRSARAKPDGRPSLTLLFARRDQRSGGFGTSAEGRRAVLWIDRMPIALAALLARRGGSLPAGVTLVSVSAMSPDARTIVGAARAADGTAEGFRTVFSDVPTR